jgi:sugar lactone lactonase YvrE
VAGSGISGYDDAFSGDGGPAIAAHLYFPSAVAVDAPGNIYIADQDNQRIRKVNTLGIISTIAGSGTAGYFNSGIATTSDLNYPSGVAVDTAGNVYVADAANYRIRKITPAGGILSIAGNGLAGYSGDGGAATIAKIQPIDVAVDIARNIYIADGPNNRIRKIDTAGIIHTIAGTGTAGFTGDGGAATAAEINSPGGVKVDAIGNVYFSDYTNRIRMIDTTGIIHTIAGTGAAGFSGDGGLATLAEINNPAGVAIDKSGNVYIADAANYRIRKISNTLAVPVVNNVKDLCIFPNPATTSLTIVSTDNILQVVITNLLGQTLYTNAYHTTHATVDISVLPGGVYFIKVNNTEVRKFVKE